MSRYYVESKGEKWWRYGKIVIDGSLYFTKPDLIYEALTKIRFLPVNAKHDLYSNRVVLYGFSPAFKLIRRGEKAPEYKIQIDSKSFLEECSYNMDLRVKEVG